MANLLDILSNAKNVKDAVVDGRFMDAWEATIPLQQFAIEAGRATGLKASLEDEKVKADINATLNECVECLNHPPTSSQPTKAIGDGQILKLILQLVTTLLPLFV